MDFYDLREGDQEDLDLCLLKLRKRTDKEVVREYQRRQYLLEDPKGRRIIFEGEEKFNPNTQDLAGWTILHRAVSNNHPKMVRLLLKMGANPDVQIECGRTPLHMACIRRNHKMVEILLQEGKADPNIRDEVYGVTALHISLYYDDNLNIFKALLEAGADPSIQNNSDKSVLDLVLRGWKNARELSDYTDDVHAQYLKIMSLLQGR